MSVNTVMPSIVDVKGPLLFVSATTAMADAGDCVTMMLAAMSASENWHVPLSGSMNGTSPPFARPKTTSIQTTKQMAVTLDYVIVMMRRNKARSSGKYNSAPALMLMKANAN